MLSGSYVGKAQMVNLLSYWLSLAQSEAERDQESTHQMIEGHLKNLLLERFDPRKADSIFAEGAVSAGNEAGLTEDEGGGSWRH